MADKDKILKEVRHLTRYPIREIWSNWVDYCDSGITMKEYLDAVIDVMLDYFDDEDNAED